MGMSAEIIAVGPFSPEVAGFLGYPARLYANTREGAIVTCRLFRIAEGSTLSRQLAALLGVSDAWDFNQHQIDRTMVMSLVWRLSGSSTLTMKPMSKH